VRAAWLLSSSSRDRRIWTIAQLVYPPQIVVDFGPLSRPGSAGYSSSPTR
jgi:hypothetical protein